MHSRLIALPTPCAKFIDFQIVLGIEIKLSEIFVTLAMLLPSRSTMPKMYNFAGNITPVASNFRMKAGSPTTKMVLHGRMKSKCLRRLLPMTVRREKMQARASAHDPRIVKLSLGKQFSPERPTQPIADRRLVVGIGPRRIAQLQRRKALLLQPRKTWGSLLRLLDQLSIERMVGRKVEHMRE